jgi:hypothetical protein
VILRNVSFRIFGSASLPVGIAVFHGLRAIGYVIYAKRTLNFAVWVNFSIKMGLFLGSLGERRYLTLLDDKACMFLDPVETDGITSLAHKVAAGREILLGKEDLLRCLGFLLLL